MAHATIFTQELGTKICARIAGGESLRAICREDDMPSRMTVHRWIIEGAGLKSTQPNDEKVKFCDQYEEAVDVRAETMAEEIMEIADDGTNDFVEKQSENGGEYTVVDREHIQRSRLRTDVRKWYLSKVRPKKFGDKLDVTSGGDKMPTPLFANIPVVPTNAIPIHNSNEEDSSAE